MTGKTLDGWLIVDWKSGKLRARQTEPAVSDLATNELKARVEFDVSVPEVDVPTLSLDIDVPEPRVYAATLDDMSDEDLPDWSGTAIEAVDEHREWFESGDTTDFETGVDRAVVTTLQNAPGRPDVDNVQEFVRQTARDIDDNGVAPVSGSN